jgi:dihydroorotate dehydrogenase (NAD+) catalytic subunit
MSAGPDMRTDLAGLELASPVLVASGTFGSGREYADLTDLSRLGAIVTKGVSPEPWSGNPSPRIAETASGMLNSIGLQNPGVEAFCEGDLAWLAEQDLPVIVNVAGHTVEEYARVVERLEAEPAVVAYELNVSCPNVDHGGMAFGTTCEGVASVVAACRPITQRPLIAKLSPNVTDVVEIARSAVDAGADALSLINTLLGMSVDVRTRRPRLARVVGGLSGPAVKPVALRMVWQTASAVDVPIVGMGGIASGEDAIEFILAGATAIAVGTANFVDPRATSRVHDGIAEYCRESGVARVADLVGTLDA